MWCPACRIELPEEARFCLRCGLAADGSPKPEAAPDPLLPSLTKALGRQYQIERLLGRGGMGAVYLATEPALERKVAIKVLPPESGGTSESRERFVKEARIAAKLSHPNIVPLHTFGEVDGMLYFVMGYIRGESVGARLRKQGRLPIADTRRILMEIADALSYAHSLGIVHRDIKPDNILLEEGTGRALLTDFGVAKAAWTKQMATSEGVVLGTPPYMSPEQARGETLVDGRSDIYSLGIMGYAMVAGRLPFEGATPSDLPMKHLSAEAPPLSTLAPDAPVELASALTRCLAKRPDDRWPDAATLRAALTPPDEDETPPAMQGLSFVFWRILAEAGCMLLLAAWGWGQHRPA